MRFVCHYMFKGSEMLTFCLHRPLIQALKTPMKQVLCYFNYDYDFLYLIVCKSISVIGGWGNVRTLIRKNGHVLAKTKEYNILSDTRPVKIILEVTKTGVIRIFTDHNKSKPFLEVQDDSPITDINFISFSGYYRDLDFFYNCGE